MTPSTRRLTARRPAGARSRGGFSLVEAMMGMTLLAIALTSVAKLDYDVMSRSRTVSRNSYGNATLVSTVNRYVAMDFDSLSAHAGCVTITTPPVPRSVCTTVTSPTYTTKQVTIILQLTGTTAHPDTVVIKRASPTSGNPFNHQ